MKQLYLTILLFLIAIPVSAEKLVKGHVLDEQEEPIIGANIYWEGTQQGTTSDADGYFELKRKENVKNLVVSYIGYTTAVVPVEDTSKPLRIVLVGEVALQEVVISERKWGRSLPVPACCKPRRSPMTRFAGRLAVIWRRASRQTRLSMSPIRMPLPEPARSNC